MGAFRAYAHRIRTDLALKHNIIALKCQNSNYRIKDGDFGRDTGT